MTDRDRSEPNRTTTADPDRPTTDIETMTDTDPRIRTDGRTTTDEQSTTDAPTTTEQSTTESRSLGEISHTNPNTGRAFGGTFTYARGRAVAADGGERDAVPDGDTVPDRDAEEEEMDPDTLEDVQHTPPNESDDANRVFERGEEDGAPVEDE